MEEDFMFLESLLKSVLRHKVEEELEFLVVLTGDIKFKFMYIGRERVTFSNFDAKRRIPFGWGSPLRLRALLKSVLRRVSIKSVEVWIKGENFLIGERAKRVGLKRFIRRVEVEHKDTEKHFRLYLLRFNKAKFLVVTKWRDVVLFNDFEYMGELFKVGDEEIHHPDNPSRILVKNSFWSDNIKINVRGKEHVFKLSRGGVCWLIFIWAKKRRFVVVEKSYWIFRPEDIFLGMIDDEETFDLLYRAFRLREESRG